MLYTTQTYMFLSQIISNEFNNNLKNTIMTKTFLQYSITPHFTNDKTNKVIFLVFEGNRLVMDIQYNNGHWLLWTGHLAEEIEDRSVRSSVIVFTSKWIKELV